MDLVKVGYVSSTHGIKGEIKILSDFEHKEMVFKKGVKIYIDNEEEIISTYRVHKQFDMITMEGYSNINEVLKYVKSSVYVNRENLVDVDYLIDDLVGMSVMCCDESLGIVREIIYNGINRLVGVDYTRNYYIPINDNFIKSVDVSNKVIKVSDDVRGLII